MSAGAVNSRVEHNDATMANTLESSKELTRQGWDACCGIHGHARARKGIKRGTSAARRRHDKNVIEQNPEE